MPVTSRLLEFFCCCLDGKGPKVFGEQLHQQILHQHPGMHQQNLDEQEPLALEQTLLTKGVGHNLLHHDADLLFSY